VFWLTETPTTGVTAGVVRLMALVVLAGFKVGAPANPREAPHPASEGRVKAAASKRARGRIGFLSGRAGRDLRHAPET